jgi:hypothetical protein
MEQTMKGKNLTIYDLLYSILILVALGLRLVFISEWSLSDKEASLVLSAINEPSTIYQVWTSLLFKFFSENEFFARILPVLFGTGLVILPFLLRKYLGDMVSLLMAVGLTFDPGLIAISKQAGPEIMAVVSLFALLVFLYEKKWIPAGIFLSIGIMSGYQFWVGAISLFLCAGFTLLFKSKNDEEDTDNDVINFLRLLFSSIDWKQLISAFGISLIVGGTLLFSQTKGLAGIAKGIIDFFVRENPGFNSMPVIPILFGLTSAYICLLIFGIIGSRRIPASWREFIWQWVLIVFILVSVFPNRQLADYIWLILPLYYPAAKFLSELRLKSEEDKFIVIGSAIALGMLLIFALYSLMHFINATPFAFENEEAVKYLITSIVAFLVFNLVIVIIGWGWSNTLSHDLLVYILVGGLLVTYFVPAMRSTGFGAKPQNLMWVRTSYFEDADLFNRTITLLDQNRMEKKEALAIQLQGVDTDSLKWELRNYRVSMINPEFGSEVEMADVILSNNELSPQVTENRMGQDLILTRMPGWSIMSNREYFFWMLDQRPVYNDQYCIVWASLYEGSLEVINDPVQEEEIIQP